MNRWRELTHLDLSTAADRGVPLLPFWDGNTWHMWVPHENKTLIKLRVGSPVAADYFAKYPEKPSDLFIPFINTMWQKATWPETIKILEAIGDDFHCLAASVAKLKHIHKNQKGLDSYSTSLFASTELQYICVVARSVFDLLQELIATIWDQKLFLYDEEMNKKKKSRKLPSTFSKMILKNKKDLKTAAEITEEYLLPRSISDEYVKAAEFFQVLRAYRDNVVHGRGSTPLIFPTERGFCIRHDNKTFNQLMGWDNKQKYNENLISLLPWINQLISQTIESCNSIVTSLEKLNAFLPEIAPGCRVFVRGVCNNELIEIQNNLYWWD